MYCGIDVGKTGHHAGALDPAGKRIFDKAMLNDESRLREVFDRPLNHITLSAIQPCRRSAWTSRAVDAPPLTAE